MAANIDIPQHIAIIMDGNGRWAQSRNMPRVAGHRAGVDAVRRVIKACGERNIQYLTLFAFSSENWQRPIHEVNHLMELFLSALKNELNELHQNNIQIRVIGDVSRFNPHLKDWIAKAEQLTHQNTGLKVNIAANYGGRWDVTQAVQKLAAEAVLGKLDPQSITAETISAHLATADIPEPDLFIRPSGEQRISNFLIWQLAYTELFFTKTLWPDFDNADLDEALRFFASRERRFGCTSEQLDKNLQMVSA